jgi:hypothetical protein
MATLNWDHSETNALGRRWQQAWEPTQTILKYALTGVFIGVILLLPVAFVFGQLALVFAAFSALTGIGIGVLIWYRSCQFVRETHLQTVAESYTLNREGDGDSIIYGSSLSPEHEPARTPAPAKYTATLVEINSEWCSINDVMLDISDFSVTEQRSQVPTEKIQSQSFDGDTFVLETNRGTWEIAGLNPSQDEDFLAVEHSH